MPVLNVIVIDDSVTIRAVMEELLRHEAGFGIAGIAANAEQARELMRARPHDVVTLDLAMPGMDGFQFLDELSQSHHAPVVVVSSATKSGTSAEADALDKGAFACFDKAAILSDAKGFLKLLRKAGMTKRTQIAA